MVQLLCEIGDLFLKGEDFLFLERSKDVLPFESILLCGDFFNSGVEASLQVPLLPYQLCDLLLIILFEEPYLPLQLFDYPLPLSPLLP